MPGMRVTLLKNIVIDTYRMSVNFLSEPLDSHPLDNFLPFVAIRPEVTVFAPLVFRPVATVIERSGSIEHR